MPLFNTNTNPILQPASTAGNTISFYQDELSIYIAATGGGGGGTPGGSNTQVQFNDAGAFGADPGLVYNKTTDTLTGLGNFSASGFIATGETADRMAIFDGGKKITAADTGTYPSLTEFSYVKGGISNFQTQINSLNAGAKLYLFNAY